MFILVVVLAIGAISVDLFNLGLGMRRLRGHGPSGIPLVGMVLFAVAMGAGWISGHISVESAFYKLKWYALFHFITNFGVLLIFDLALRAFRK